jgi:hypothetical protein
MPKRKTAKVRTPIESYDVSEFFDSLPDGFLLQLGEIEAERAIARATVVTLWEAWMERRPQKQQKEDSEPETGVDRTETKAT